MADEVNKTTETRKATKQVEELINKNFSNTHKLTVTVMLIKGKLHQVSALNEYLIG